VQYPLKNTMIRDVRLYLNDIIQAMESIERFVTGMCLEDLMRDDKTASAVILKLEIIGEATKHIPLHIKEKYPGIPWKEIAGMRDRLIHAYFGIDYRLVWDAIELDIPDIKPKLLEIIAELEKEG
jgi:uncharacterized protein with HEPN domain